MLYCQRSYLQLKGKDGVIVCPVSVYSKQPLAKCILISSTNGLYNFTGSVIFFSFLLAENSFVARHDIKEGFILKFK